ncbi:unnamed protein product [Ilex paraguariensis]|uniref:peptidylprolyl isomerase n=1 Tax=Ilex paraguariensis TaxID=185542 RepID=A0ABC8SN87_9AQUA
MKVGGKRTVLVPPEAGYGKKGMNEIPRSSQSRLEHSVSRLSCAIFQCRHANLRACKQIDHADEKFDKSMTKNLSMLREAKNVYYVEQDYF